MLENLQKLPMDSIFKVVAAFKSDPNPQKVNLGIGLYFDDKGNPFVFETVKKAWARVDTNNFNYQPLEGNHEFLSLCAELVLGENFDHNRVALQATCGGTQTCSFMSALIARDSEKQRDILIAVPTWSNHFALFRDLNCVKFEHLDERGEVNFKEYLRVVKEAKEGTSLLIHGGLAHNPSGRNLSLEQLKELVPILNEKKMMLFVDYAYLGLSEGFEKDREYAQYLFEKMDNFALGLSFSKNASLYEHRTGCLMVKTEQKKTVESHLQQIARASVSMAPGIGQEIAIMLMRDTRTEWLKELEEVRQSILSRKSRLIDLLPESFAFLKNTSGMFGLLGLYPEQIESLRKDYSLYLPGNGRINFAGLVDDQIEYVSEAIAGV